MKLTIHSLCFLLDRFKESYGKTYVKLLESTHNTITDIENGTKENTLYDGVDSLKNLLTSENRLQLYKLQLLDTKFDKTLVFSEKSKKNLKNYKVPKEFRIGVLESLTKKANIIQVDENTCYYYVKTDTEIVVMKLVSSKSYVSNFFNGPILVPQTGLYYTPFFFAIDFLADKMNEKNIDNIGYGNEIKRLVIYNDAQNPVDGTVLHDMKDFMEHLYADFIVALTYVEFTDVSFDIVYSNSKRGDIMKGNNIKNESKFNVIQVNTNWNTTKVHIGDTFDVTGHWRLQPYGSGRTRYKYIFIDTYEKTGIIKRKAGKDIHTKS